MNVHERAQAAAEEIDREIAAERLTPHRQKEQQVPVIAAIIEKKFAPPQFVVSEKNFSDLPKAADGTVQLAAEEVQAYITWLEKRLAKLEAAMERIRAMRLSWNTKLSFVPTVDPDLLPEQMLMVCMREFDEAIAGPEVKDE